MPVPRYNQIHQGKLVSIVLKADQRTGRQVQGTVAALLTRGDHPRGVKVRLSDGRIGRVQQLLVSEPTTQQQNSIQSSYTPPRAYQMASQQNTYSSGPGHQQQSGNQTNAPRQPTRTDTDLLPQGQERAEQMEHMQSYEATVPQSQDDTNQATLQKEFPNIDSSLIAALYGDSKNLNETRELLQELGSS